jgi:hypothetical protein
MKRTSDKKKHSEKIVEYKGWPQKKLTDQILYSSYLESGDQIFKILVSTPHNTHPIKGDRHNNFEDPIPGLKI